MQGNTPRRPGELAFTIAMLLGSLYLLWSAYGIAGFEALSSPGAIPMLATGAMVVCAAIILRDTLRKPGQTSERFSRAILPVPVAVTIAMIGAYALALKPVGFIPTSFVFLAVLIRYLSRRSLLQSVLLSLGIVALVYAVFRLVFTVLMPPGIVPEGEILAFVRTLFAGGN